MKSFVLPHGSSFPVSTFFFPCFSLHWFRLCVSVPVLLPKLLCVALFIFSALHVGFDVIFFLQNLADLVLALLGTYVLVLIILQTNQNLFYFDQETDVPQTS